MEELTHTKLSFTEIWFMVELCGSVEDQIQSSTHAVFVKVLVKEVYLQPNLTHIVNETATV